MGELALEDFHICQQVTGLKAGDDALLCKAGDVGSVDEFAVFNAQGRRLSGEEGRREFMAQVVPSIQRGTDCGIADCMNGKTDVVRAAGAHGMGKIIAAEQHAAPRQVGEGMGVRFEHPGGAGVERAIGKDFGSREGK